jgi:hypothetical protein
MACMLSSAGNKLENWIGLRALEEKAVLNLLQEYGVISDNSIWAKDVGNDRDAMMWMARNFERFKAQVV